MDNELDKLHCLYYFSVLRTQSGVHTLDDHRLLRTRVYSVSFVLFFKSRNGSVVLFSSSSFIHIYSEHFAIFHKKVPE